MVRYTLTKVAFLDTKTKRIAASGHEKVLLVVVQFKFFWHLYCKYNEATNLTEYTDPKTVHDHP